MRYLKWAMTFGVLVCCLVAMSGLVTENGFAKGSSFRSPPGWRKINTENFINVGMWQSKKNKKVFVKVHKVKVGKKFDFKSLKASKIVKDLEVVRGRALRPFGISKWKVKKYRFKKSKGKRAYLLKVIGQYRGLKSKIVQFEEWQYFRGTQMVQITYSEEGKKFSTQKRASVFKSFSPWGT